jgi:hypothetical protein
MAHSRVDVNNGLDPERFELVLGELPKHLHQKQTRDELMQLHLTKVLRVICFDSSPYSRLTLAVDSESHANYTCQTTDMRADIQKVFPTHPPHPFDLGRLSVSWS